MIKIIYEESLNEKPSLLRLGRWVHTIYLNYGDLKLAERSLKLFRLISNPARHKRVMQAISAPCLHPILNRYPTLSLNYLKSNYLASNLTTSQRADAVCHHYNFVANNIRGQAIQKILFDELPIWTFSSGDKSTHSLSVLLSESFAQTFRTGSFRINYEGEFSMHYRFDHTLIYIMSFTFASERIYGGKDETIVLVTRIQGVADNFVFVRNATKSLEDISPPFALMSALEGFSNALGLKNLIGVSQDRKNSTLKLKHIYTDLFVSLGATQVADFGRGSRSVTYFLLPIPIPEKPITDVKRSHRSRVNAKRRFRKQISTEVHDTTIRHIAMPR